MVHRPAAWFRNVAILGAVVALVFVPVVSYLMHGTLPLWLHIPVTVVALTLMAGGALAAGVAYVEYQARNAKTE